MQTAIVVYMRLLQERKMGEDHPVEAAVRQGALHSGGGTRDREAERVSLPQRAPCTCKHGDSTISDPRKQPAEGTGSLTSAACSKRQISVPDVDLNLSTQQVDDEFDFAPWITSAPLIAMLVVRAESSRDRQQISCRVNLIRRITAGTKDRRVLYLQY